MRTYLGLVRYDVITLTFTKTSSFRKTSEQKEENDSDDAR